LNEYKQHDVNNTNVYDRELRSRRKSNMVLHIHITTQSLLLHQVNSKVITKC